MAYPAHSLSTILVLEQAQVRKAAPPCRVSHSCRAHADVVFGLQKFREKVERKLMKYRFEGDHQKVARVSMRVVTMRTPKGEHFTFHMRADFAACEESEAHQFFAAEAGIVAAPDMRTMVSLALLDHGALLNRTEKAASFRGLAHGHVTMHEPFECFFFYHDGYRRRLRVTFASAQTPIEIIPSEDSILPLRIEA